MWMRVGIVGLILVLAIGTNVTVNMKFTEQADHFPFIGVAVWVAILLSIPMRRPDWKVLPEALKGAIFLLSLVLCASMMPVEKLPLPSWETAFGLGFLSAVFDNIPLPALRASMRNHAGVCSSEFSCVLALGASGQRINIRPSTKLNVLYCPIFRVPEYSEFSVRLLLGADKSGGRTF